MPTTVLLIDDDPALCESLARFLAMHDLQVTCLPTVREGEAGIQAGGWDLVLLDVGLPDGDGRELLRWIRGRSGLPVIMLTAQGDAGDRIAGLEDGADDFVPKPFVPRELLARIRAVLRRRGGAAGGCLAVGDLRVDLPTRRVLQGGGELPLTAAEFDILLILLRRCGTCVTREELSEQALGRPLGSCDRTIDNHISNLRRKLGPRSGPVDRIRSIRNLGYCYTGFLDA